MPGRLSTLLLFALWIACGVPMAGAQIAPDDEDAPTVPGTAIAADVKSRQTTAPAIAVTIRGWTFGSELDGTRLLRGTEVKLDPGHPEIILFYDTVQPGTQLSALPLEFRYRLDGYDNGWTVTHERLAHYRRLSPGSYTFQVQARTAGQPWPDAVALLPVQQRPFFYQTWYAYVLVGVVLLGLTLQILQQRDQLLKGQIGMVLQERNRIAGECHDTLMAGFAAISWQLEATARLFREAALPNDHPASQSCELARSMVAHCQAEARRIIWDLRESDEITNSLSRALLDATSAQRERESPQTTLEVRGTEIPISPGAVHHLVCIGQEAVTNAIRHGRPSRIHIGLHYEEDLLRLTVRDDGRGFHVSDRSVRAGHFGIPVMEERARKLGGTLHLASSGVGGTEVSVTVSFHRIHQPAVQQQHIVKWIGV